MPLLSTLARGSALTLTLALTTVGSPAQAQSPPAASPQSGRILHVATTGGPHGTGTAANPFVTVQQAVDAARPGTTIAVHAGRYPGVVTITRSGTAATPITITAAGDGIATLSTDNPQPSCGATKPALARTLVFAGGADYWTVSNLSIVGGITAKGEGGSAALGYLSRLVNEGDWQTRRLIPGRGSNDPEAAQTAFGYLSSVTGRRIDPSDGLRFVDNTITRRGIQVIASRYGEISGNEIGPIDCGVGPGVWVNVFSDGWNISGNHIHDIAASTYKHYMQEGIRLGSASSYNTVSQNLVEHLPGDGRAMNTDVDASWNTFRNNVADDIAIGYNDQKSGWGNVWDHNTASNFRVWGLNFRGLDSKLPLPSLDSSPYLSIVTCNTALGGPRDPKLGGGLRIGAAKSSTFANNTISSAVLGDPFAGVNYVKRYWRSEANTWDGKGRPPRLHPQQPAPGTCG